MSGLVRDSRFRLAHTRPQRLAAGEVSTRYRLRRLRQNLKFQLPFPVKTRKRLRQRKMTAAKSRQRVIEVHETAATSWFVDK